MYRLYSFFVCILVLAACSPRNFSGEQVARTYNQSQQLDTSSFHHLVDKLVHEEVQKFMDVHEITDMTSVNEVFSAPDSTGKQHVTERTTTKLRKRSDTSAGAMQKKEEQIQEQQDSTAFHSSEITAMTEERKEVKGEVKGWCPWYIYVAALVAVVIGFCLAVRKKKWFVFS